MSKSDCDGFEYTCWKCGKHITVKQPDSSYSCPDCGTLLKPAPKTLHWIFQFNPKTYRWFDRMKETRRPEQWLASRDSEYMKKGDFVAIWASGKSAGVYALGQMVTYATYMSLSADDEKYWRNNQAIDKFLYHRSVLLEYFSDLSICPLLESRCLEDDTLKTLRVLDHLQATNFQINVEQWDRIVELTQ
jgi:DNA-directed RNA polymerase subunit RPC12/RpoP